MKKYIIFLTSALPLLLFVSTTQAQVNETPKPTRPVFRILEKKEGSAGAIKREEIKMKVDTRRRELIERYFNQMIKRFEAAIARLEKLISRIERRLNKIKAGGGETGDLEAELASANDKLIKAKNDLASLKEEGISFTTADDPKTAFLQLKQEIGLLRDGIKGVHQALVQLVTQIRGLRVGTMKEASPSSSVRPSPIL